MKKQELPLRCFSLRFVNSCFLFVFTLFYIYFAFSLPQLLTKSLNIYQIYQNERSDIYMKKALKIAGWISGMISLALFIINGIFIFELLTLYLSPPSEASSTSDSLSKGALLILLIIFMSIMDAVALIRWIIFATFRLIPQGFLWRWLVQTS